MNEWIVKYIFGPKKSPFHRCIHEFWGYCAYKIAMKDTWGEKSQSLRMVSLLGDNKGDNVFQWNKNPVLK